MKTVIKVTSHTSQFTKTNYDFVFDDNSTLNNVVISTKPFNEKMIKSFFIWGQKKYALHKYNGIAYEIR